MCRSCQLAEALCNGDDLNPWPEGHFVDTVIRHHRSRSRERQRDDRIDGSVAHPAGCRCRACVVFDWIYESPERSPPRPTVGRETPRSRKRRLDHLAKLNAPVAVVCSSSSSLMTAGRGSTESTGKELEETSRCKDGTPSADSTCEELEPTSRCTDGASQSRDQADTHAAIAAVLKECVALAARASTIDSFSSESDDEQTLQSQVRRDREREIDEEVKGLTTT